MDEYLPPVTRLSRDLAKAAATLSDAEVRFLVDAYYMMQDNRIRQDGQIRSMKGQEPHAVLAWLAVGSDTLEKQIKRALDKYTEAHPVGGWCRGIYGIGPVISAGLLAHIDITKAPTVGHIWSFAGLDPTKKWLPKTKRPWNDKLKTLCWKAGESFVKFSNHEQCFYGHLYKNKKAEITAENDAGMFSETAAQILQEKNFRKDTEAYKAYIQGKLPPAHVHARARRYAVKLFLAHLHEEMYRRILGKEPPLPYPIAHQGHVHRINSPSQ